MREAVEGEQERRRDGHVAEDGDEHHCDRMERVIAPALMHSKVRGDKPVTYYGK